MILQKYYSKFKDKFLGTIGYREDILYFKYIVFLNYRHNPFNRNQKRTQTKTSYQLTKLTINLTKHKVENK